MKKSLKVIGAVIFLVIAYLVVLQFYPKNASRFPFLAIVFLGDIYLYRSVKSWINERKAFLKNFFRILYWIPLMLLIITITITVLYPSNWWDDGVRTYIFGFIFIAYASKIIPILFLLFADFICGVRWINHKATRAIEKKQDLPIGQKITRSQFLQKAGLVSGGILGSWANQHPLEDAVSKINQLQPDLVFFTGDLVNYKSNEAYRFENTLKKLKSKHGIYATLGNHDYGDYTRWPSKAAKEQNMTDLYKFYERLGWKLLNNENWRRKLGGFWKVPKIWGYRKSPYWN
ncbi:MAG: hypothetical protein B6I19_00040 [Bacteroidetes bacterium 4572_114]|nr:MAG: hypothetical protein B6I19_00040 [Bacteroidetes bacterium 4572_114]